MMSGSKGLPPANGLNCLQASEPSCTKHCKNCEMHSQKSELATLKHADFLLVTQFIQY